MEWISADMLRRGIELPGADAICFGMALLWKQRMAKEWHGYAAQMRRSD